MVCPLDHTLCRQTVTVYHREGKEVTRLVADGCYLERQEVRETDEYGCREDAPFLLVMPGDVQRVFPGDRILEGIGPEVDADAWAAFIPVNVAGLVEAEYAKSLYWEGMLCHVEAGRK